MNARIAPFVNHHLMLLVLLALGVFTLPWMVNHAVSLTFGGYDLAEWASLHPGVRTAPLWITSMLLRLQPAILSLLVAVNAPESWRMRGRWASAFCVLVITIALLPPLEFFSTTSGDGNHQQQFGIALLTLVSGLVCLSGLLRRWRRRITAALALSGIVAGLIAYSQAQSLMGNLELIDQPGIGAPLLLALYLLVALAQV